ncbi:MAG: hypothetical protein ACYC0V_09930 [Armatimonadota bacterium]
MNTVEKRDSVEINNAVRYLEDQAYTALLGYGEPVRSGEISEKIGNAKYSAKLVRHIMAASSRFAQIDRRWDIEARYEDKQRTVERVLNVIIEMYGCPISIPQLASEISSVYERPAEYYEPMLERILGDEERYFCTSKDLYGLQSWLLAITSDEDDDILFDNDINPELVAGYNSIIADNEISFSDYSSAITALSEAVDDSIDNKTICFILWKSVGDSFDPYQFADEILSSSDLIWLSDHSWASKTIIKKYDAFLEKMADNLVDEPIEEAPKAVAQTNEFEESEVPILTLDISERDLDEVVQIVESRGIAHLPAILETIFEISQRDQIYQMAAEGLSESMKADPRFLWLGTDRWTMAGTIPAYVSEIPESLVIPVFNFETPEGEKIDVELDDDGLEGTLAKEINDLLVLDIFDCEVSAPKTKPGTEYARGVVTRHHKLLGTYPVCRIADGFFPTGAHIMQFSLISEESQSDIWVNKDNGIIYGMDKWYTDEMPESGTAFELQKTTKPDEFKISFSNEPDPLISVVPGRIEDLLVMAEDAVKSDLSTFDILCRIMRDHRKGIPFATLFTELNIVRRTTRRMAASILSSYYAFYQRPKSTLWQFDEKKEDQGFKKAKRKYVRK